MKNPRSNTFLGFKKLPASYAQWVMPFLLSVLMTCIVSMISTLRTLGMVAGFVEIWMRAWGWSWMFAFPVLLLILPLVRKATGMIVETP
jgi:ABC-type glycerol-3-phosphate transport system permease component